MSSATIGFPDPSSTISAPSGGESCRPTGPGRRGRPGSSGVRHFRRPLEQPFTASDRETTTILVGGLTQKHEQFIRAVFRGCGYRCEILPTPDQNAFQVGKEYGNNGQCSPAYFTAGSLIQFLKNLESEGLSRKEIIDRYAFFTAGSCGPCRFGMYAAEYRLALQNAGFDGFRVIRFQQDDGIKQKSQEPGLAYSLDFGLGMLKALFLGDVLNDLTYNIRPYEVIAGETDRIMTACVLDLDEHLYAYKPGEAFDQIPSWLAAQIAKRKLVKTTLSVLYKFRHHLYGNVCLEVLEKCRERINSIEIDRLRVKPTVKIVGEFWAQTTEGDGNYRMFEFLEREGAQVQWEAIGTWLTYLLTHAQLQLDPRRGMDSHYQEPDRWNLRQRMRNEITFQEKRALLAFGERLYTSQYHRIVDALGGTAHRLIPQRTLARLADPFYKSLARGGEGYLEVGKNIYYNLNKLCHMVLSLKPFGCMPSSQSDGVQSTVVTRFKDMIYLPIETSGEGEINAHSRVQMALGEAKVKAKAEFQGALASTGRNIEDIRSFVAQHAELRKPLYRIPHRPGVAGVAANFVLHVGDLMAGRASMQKA
jgi:predicted nucleotide-binding protein (sugar kinase/HSP70/actin superfamily)